MEQKTGFEVYCEVEEATSGLEELSGVIQLLIDNYDLSSREWTQEKAMDLGLGCKAIYATLTTVQFRIQDISEKLHRIATKKDPDQEDTETTK